MRPGAAVRLRGTWNSGECIGSFSAVGDISPGSSSEPNTSELEKLDMKQDTAGSQTAQELQVERVEILGASDPQVSAK